jgi:hypothetical protein
VMRVVVGRGECYGVVASELTANSRLCSDVVH